MTALLPASAVGSTRTGDALVLHVEGRLHEQEAPALVAALPTAGRLAGLVVDLEQASSLDQAGVAAVLAVIRRAQERGTATAIAAFDPEVLQVLLVNGISLVAPIAANATDALRLLQDLGRPGRLAVSASGAVEG